MLSGFTAIPLQVEILRGPLPAPHRTYYRDGGVIAREVARDGGVVVRSGGGGTVTLRAGVNSDDLLALEVLLQVDEVFHAFLLDALFLSGAGGFAPCDDPLTTEWEVCE